MPKRGVIIRVGFIAPIYIIRSYIFVNNKINFNRRDAMLVLFFAIWIILNGKLTLEIAIFGAVVSLVMFAFICKFMNYSIKKELMLYKSIPFLFCYIFVLIIEIVKANVDVVKRIFSVKYEQEPALVHFKSPLKSTVLNTILADSITLTPGTITVSMENGEFTVHCLDKELAVGMDKSVFVKLLVKFEEGWKNV